MSFCETVVETSSLKCFAETPNKKNKVSGQHCTALHSTCMHSHDCSPMQHSLVLSSCVCAMNLSASPWSVSGLFR